MSKTNVNKGVSGPHSPFCAHEFDNLLLLLLNYSSFDLIL